MTKNVASNIHFGTDGWRAIIGEDFTEENVIKVANAAARVYMAAVEDAASEQEKAEPPVFYVGHDCRLDAHKYAELVANEAAKHGFNVILTEDYCPTPALCWSVAHDPHAVGGIMLTSSHNPAEYLGVKLRMADGGASPKDFTDLVEAALNTDTPTSPDNAAGTVTTKNLMPAYLAALKEQVDVEAIRNANLHVALDPLYGAGRHYLANLLREMGVTVDEIHNEEDPTFAGLHPEPIQPWVDEGLAKAKEVQADALFINDGDADRIAAATSTGAFVNPHRIITLVTENMASRPNRTENRIVSTVTASQQLANACEALGLEYVTTPVGFKWIYGEMERGGVLVGGEESGGIGLPGHVKERDGLLMALLLTEMMAKQGKNLGELVEAANEKYGTFEFSRRGLELTPEQETLADQVISGERKPTEICGATTWETDARDGVKFTLPDQSWVMMRKSGTEPLVRIYAEAGTTSAVNNLLDWAETFLLNPTTPSSPKKEAPMARNNENELDLSGLILDNTISLNAGTDEPTEVRHGDGSTVLPSNPEQSEETSPIETTQSNAPEPTQEPTPAPTPESTQEPAPEPTPKPAPEPTPKPAPEPASEPAPEPKTTSQTPTQPAQPAQPGAVAPARPHQNYAQTPSERLYKKSCLAAAWEDITKQPGWLKKVILLGLVNCVPVLDFFMAGYAMQWAKELPQGQVKPMPQKIFEKSFFVNGFYSWVIELVIGLVTVIATIILAVIPVLGSVASSLIPLALIPVQAVAVLRIALAGRLAPGFDVSKIIEIIKKNPSAICCATIVPALIVGAVTTVVIVALGLIAVLPVSGIISSIDYYGIESAYSLSLLAGLVASLLPFISIIVIVACVLEAMFTLLIYRATGHYLARYGNE